MARYLALDWDNREFHLVAANVGHGKVQIQRAISWREDQPFVPAAAEQFAGRLRERLKTAGIAAAPLIVGLGRDRVVVREVRFPQVSPEVEAAVVRNQIIKDLTESPDDVLLDYTPLPEPSRSGERRALSVVVRKDMIQALQTVSRVAGLKLAAVTARPFGIAACLKHLAGTVPQVPAPPAADAVSAVLTATSDWAEFCAVRGDQLLFARSVTVGDLAEVRRNLAAYAGQPQLSFPRDAIQALYVSGNGENALLREKLQQTLGIAVHGLDPFIREERVDVEAGNRAGFTGAVGLLHIWASDEATPVNFVKPRESKQTASPAKRRVLIYGAAAAVAAVFLVGGGFVALGMARENEKDLAKKVALKDQQLKALQPDIKYYEALADWNDTAISWLDEIYDLAARAPYAKEFRINKVTITTGAGKASPKTAAKDKGKDKDKDRYTAKLMIEGSVDAGSDKLIQKFMADVNKDNEKHVRCTERNTRSASAKKIEFTLQVDIMRQLPSQYSTILSK